MSEQSEQTKAVIRLAEAVFESREAAERWMSMPNLALGGSTPLAACDTALGAQQVRSILNSIEWGGVV
jgi:uncharacterized protein (DUF2384 family)